MILHLEQSVLILFTTIPNFSGKTHKKSRVSVKVYALVIVCIMTGATNILALEGLETADMVQALERHGMEYLLSFLSTTALS